ncbi:Ankyrin repeat [Dillenia turbinata]|uniref:Ankyrin repeat n=1 Tax=Dillenia turbinata TaxID=194707 RepID=A0AAN8Z0J3_9MAGN
MEMEIDDPKPEIKDEDLFKAAELGNVSVFESLSPQQLLHALSLKNEDVRSLLHVAASSGQTEVVRILAAVDPSISGINSTDEEGWVPLHSAASIGNLEIVEILISRGAEVDAVDKAGQTPLMNAVICQNKEVALLLVRHGADVDVEDKEGYTVLVHAPDDFRSVLVDAAKTMLEG